jgi:hypothetical protein
MMLASIAIVFIDISLVHLCGDRRPAGRSHRSDGHVEKFAPALSRGMRISQQGIVGTKKSARPRDD